MSEYVANQQPENHGLAPYTLPDRILLGLNLEFHTCCHGSGSSHLAVSGDIL